MLCVYGKGTKVVLIPLPPAVGRSIDRAIGTRTRGPIQEPRPPPNYILAAYMASGT